MQLVTDFFGIIIVVVHGPTAVHVSTFTHLF